MKLFDIKTPGVQFAGHIERSHSPVNSGWGHKRWVTGRIEIITLTQLSHYKLKITIDVEPINIGTSEIYTHRKRWGTRAFEYIRNNYVNLAEAAYSVRAYYVY